MSGEAQKVQAAFSFVCIPMKTPIELIEMSALQNKVAELGMCPICHKKSLVAIHTTTDWAYSQCNICGRVIVLENKPCDVKQSDQASQK